MSKRLNPQKVKSLEQVKPEAFTILCAWCGATIRTSPVEMPEQMCLICHARMLNDYFQRSRKTGADKQT